MVRLVAVAAMAVALSPATFSRVAYAQKPEGRRQPALRGLGHTMQRLRTDKALVVGYFGGSITEGAGASEAGKTSWRALTTAYLKAQYPEAAITEVNAAIGGTGSDLGAFRCQTDLMKHRPDLVFIEFAVNDSGAGEERTLRAMEGIVRQLRRANPQPDLVFVYTANKPMEAAYKSSKLPVSVERHHRVAVHYGIPEINVGEKLYQEIAREHNGDWGSLTTDGTHPNDRGYALYAAEAAAFLQAHQNDKPSPSRRRAGVAAAALPVPLTAHPLEQGVLLDAWSLPAARGWIKEDKSLSGRYPHRLTATSADAGILSFRFTGDAIGLYWQIAPDSGDIEWSVDNSPWKRTSAWDSYALKFTRANYVLLSDALMPGPHELRLRVAAERHPQSTGNTIRIGALLVNGVAQ